MWRDEDDEILDHVAALIVDYHSFVIETKRIDREARTKVAYLEAQSRARWAVLERLGLRPEQKAGIDEYGQLTDVRYIKECIINGFL